MGLHFETLPLDFPLIVHLLLVALLMLLFPFSKPFCMSRVSFSARAATRWTTRAKRRHLAPWAKAMEEQKN